MAVSTNSKSLFGTKITVAGVIFEEGHTNCEGGTIVTEDFATVSAMVFPYKEIELMFTHVT